MEVTSVERQVVLFYHVLPMAAMLIDLRSVVFKRLTLNLTRSCLVQSCESEGNAETFSKWLSKKSWLSWRIQDFQAGQITMVETKQVYHLHTTCPSLRTASTSQRPHLSELCSGAKRSGVGRPKGPARSAVSSASSG